MSNIIEMSGITKEYPFKGGVVRALRGIDVNVEKGDFVSIKGPSGSGKST